MWHMLTNRRAPIAKEDSHTVASSTYTHTHLKTYSISFKIDARLWVLRWAAFQISVLSHRLNINPKIHTVSNLVGPV